MLRPRFIASLTCVLLSCPVYAQEAWRVSVTPMPWLAQGEGSGSIPPEYGPATVTAADTLVYSNTHYNYFDPPAWFPAGPGVTVADDVHMLMPGSLTQLFFFYNEPVSVVVRPTLTIYANEDDGSVGTILVGPLALGAFRWGPFRVHVTFNEPVPLVANLWFALSFDSATAGAVMANPPFTGTSNATYYSFASGRTEQLFGPDGPVPANFYLQIFVEHPVAVVQTTWSQVKALYRSPSGATRN